MNSLETSEGSPDGASSAIRCPKGEGALTGGNSGPRLPTAPKLPNRS